MRILLVEDDAILADAVYRALTQSAHMVELARNGDEAEAALRSSAHDLVILDVNIPGPDGLEVLRRLRSRGERVPVLMITVRDAVEDRVKGLDLGADDYLAKPFHLFELEARVRALIRRSNSHASANIVHGRVRLDTEGRRVFCDGNPVDLTSRELAVLELLLLRAGRVVTKQQIVDTLYGWEEGSSSNTVEVFIHRLRRKLEATGMNIRTVRGMGYLVDNAT
jgi:two-component system OmpR family response regulator